MSWLGSQSRTQSRSHPGWSPHAHAQCLGGEQVPGKVAQSWGSRPPRATKSPLVPIPTAPCRQTTSSQNPPASRCLTIPAVFFSSCVPSPKLLCFAHLWLAAPLAQRRHSPRPARARPIFAAGSCLPIWDRLKAARRPSIAPHTAAAAVAGGRNILRPQLEADHLPGPIYSVAIHRPRRARSF